MQTKFTIMLFLSNKVSFTVKFICYERWSIINPIKFTHETLTDHFNICKKKKLQNCWSTFISKGRKLKTNVFRLFSLAYKIYIRFWLNQYKKKKKKRTSALVSHGGMINTVVCLNTHTLTSKSGRLVCSKPRLIKLLENLFHVKLWISSTIGSIYTGSSKFRGS